MYVCFVFMLVSATSVFGAGITFTFDNIENTGTSPRYCEFDVMAQADVEGTQLGDAMVYLNYSTAGFGEAIAANGKITVDKGTLLQGEYWSSVPPPGHWEQYYEIIGVVDNTNSRVAITTEYNDALVGPPWTNFLQTTPTQLLHISIEIADASQTAGLSFEESLMDEQQYESYNTPATKYNPVVADFVPVFYDWPLPVQLSSFTAHFRDGQVLLRWTTESEMDNLGFHIYRALEEEGEYDRITADLIEGAGTASNQQTYTFTDPNVTPGITYWYKLEDVAFDGTRMMHGAISVRPQIQGEVVVAVPDAYALSPCYPNPFNPSTSVRYQLPEPGEVRLAIYDVLGQEVRVLVSERQPAGWYRVSWDGRDEAGQPVSSGVYLYRLEAGADFVRTHKALLLR